MTKVTRVYRSSDGSIHENITLAERKNIEIDVLNFLLESIPEIDRSLAEKIAVKMSMLRSRMEDIFDRGGD